MDLTIDHGVLLPGLYLTHAVASRRSTAPEYECVLLDAVTGTVTLRATNGEHAIATTRTCKVARSGSLAVNAQRLYQLVRGLPPERPIRMHSVPGTRLEVTIEGFSVKLTGFTEFPSMPAPVGKVKAIELPAADLVALIGQVLIAVHPEPARGIIHGLYVTANLGRLCLVGTDGTRMAIVDSDVAAEDLKAAIPRAGAEELRRILEASDQDAIVRLSAGEGMLHAVVGSTTFSVRLLEGEYPDWTQAIPTDEGAGRMTLKTPALLAALKRTQILSARGAATPVTFNYRSTGLLVSSANVDTGELEETVPVKYEGTEVVVAYNADFWAEQLGVLNPEEEVYVEVRAIPGATIVRGGKTTHIILPRRFA